jgi:regulator of replication initiation timing
MIKEVSMDARELTKKYYEMSNKLTDAIKDIEFLKSENEKLRMKLDDLSIDVKMLTNDPRR